MICPTLLRRLRLLPLFLAVFWAEAEALAGSYSQNFNAATVGTMSAGDASVIAAGAGTLTTSIQQVAAGNNALMMMAVPWAGNSSSWKMPDLDPGKPIQSFDATFLVRMSGTGTPGAGWSLNFGAILSGNGGGEGGFAMTGGLTVAWDIYNNGGSDLPSIEVFAGGVSVGNSPRTFVYDTTYRTVAVHWDANGLDVTYGGVAIFTDLPVPGFVPLSGNKFAFSVRAESSAFDMFLDDVVLTTAIELPVETGGPVISEFMADNNGTLEDEDTDASDWIEIYNGQNATVNLSGWRLTNVQGNNSMWTIPSVSVGPYGYLVVYASAKNRTTNTALLHTNFTLQKESGYLALVKADGVTLASQFTYGPQFQDISYGEKGAAHTLGYLQPATPGAKTGLSTAQAPGGPAEDVVWSREGGVITAATPAAVTITAPVAAGAVIRYTTDNTEPGAASPVYTPGSPPAAFTVATTLNLRARIFTPGMLPGPVTSRTFLLIDSTLTNYNGSGQIFSSHLPIIVLESFGIPVDSYSDSNAARPYRYTYAVAIDKDGTGRASLTSPTVDFQGRSGTHVRGSSSAGFPQKQYAWELWDNSGNDKHVSVLGMPAESDWVLYAPYDDKALMRNFLTYTRGRLLTGANGFAMRTKYCEVFFNQEAGQPVSASDYRGVYVLVERIKAGKDRVDIPKINSLTTDPTLITGGYIFKHDRTGSGDTFFNTAAGGVEIGSVEPSTWNSAQTTYLNTFFNNFETALNGANFGDPALGYQAYIDRDTFIDNQWFVEIAKQIDGYRLSQYFWKDRAGKLKNGPLWDYNLAFGNADYLNGYDPTGWYYTQLGGADYAWFPRLHQHTTGANPYELRHWDRYWELRRGLFATAPLMAEIDAEASTLLNGNTTPVGNNTPANLSPLLENAVMRHYRKWPILGTYTWPNAPGYDQRIYFNSNGNVNTGEVDWMKNWLTARLGWIDDQNLPLTGTYSQTGTAITVAATAHGKVATASAWLTFTSGNPSSPANGLYVIQSVPNANTFTVTAADSVARSGNLIVPTVFRPPNSSQYGGNVNVGTQVTLSPYAGTPPAGYTYAAGTIYYTTNGSDPRGSNGLPAGTAYVSAITLNASQTVKARLYSNGSWSPLTNSAFVVNAVPASVANLAVSEIMYHPVNATNAEIAAGYVTNDFEYVELLNTGATDVDLSNVALTDGVLFNFGTNNPALLTLPPGGRIVIVGNVNAFLLRYGNNAAVRVAGAYTGNLSNSGEQLIVTSATGATIAQFTYGTAEPWPVDADVAGYSLVLNNPAPNLNSAYYNDGTHWRSSALLTGSPGLANSTPFTGSPTGDTDGDGVSDFFEYATGSNMGSAASRNLPITTVAPFTVAAGTLNFLKLDYRRNLSADGVHYAVLYSTDLTNWVSDTNAVTYVGTHNNGDGTATVTYRSTQPIDAAHPRMFLRLSVTP